MKIAVNHEAAVIHIDDVSELEEIVQTLRVLNGRVRADTYVGDDKRKLKVHSLRGMVATIRLEDVEPIE